MNAIQHVVCLVANLGTENVEVVLRVIGESGAVLQELPHTLGNLPQQVRGRH